MFYDLQEVEAYVEHFYLNQDNGFAEVDVEGFIEHIDVKKVPKFDYETGASKLVIIPWGRDYVIKIPFNGEYQCGWDEDGKEYDYFEPFCGAHDCLYGDNYCEAERIAYNDAITDGWDDFFMPIYLVTWKNGYPIYVQERVDCFCNDTEDADQASYSSQEARDKLKNNNAGCSLARLWLASCLTVLDSLDELNEFIQYLRNTEIIQDLHRGNLGYSHGKPVIVDYGGYYD